jgi:hypothetical protein
MFLRTSTTSLPCGLALRPRPAASPCGLALRPRPEFAHADSIVLSFDFESLHLRQELEWRNLRKKKTKKDSAIQQSQITLQT